MDSHNLSSKSLSYLKTLCEQITERCVGSPGNRAATEFFERTVSGFGWQTQAPEFDALDWEDGGADLTAGQESFAVQVSPYSLGCSVEAPLVAASTPAELERLALGGNILLLYGEIAREQLMPKNFVFYNPEEHQRIIGLLEAKQPAAIVTATGRNAALAGGVYPFPMIEDGDFDIPSVYMTAEEGVRLLAYAGRPVRLESRSRRIPGKGCNVIATRGHDPAGRIVITAHIDAKKGTPGAIDNASGVVVLLLLAELLQDYAGKRLLEIVALNGEDYYAASGQMDYVWRNQGKFDQIRLNINIDGAGYHQGKSAFSLFDLPADLQARAEAILAQFDGIVEGPQWFQGDHSMFLQHGRPTIAVSSQWFVENVDSQEITHTPKDRVEIVDCRKLVEIAEALSLLVRE